MIQFDKSYFDNINSYKIENLINITQPYFNYRIGMYQRYTRKKNITDTMTSFLSKTMNIPFEIYMVNMLKGYLSGKPPAYVVKEKKGEKRTNTPQIWNDTLVIENDNPAEPKSSQSEQNYSELYQEKIDYIRRYNDDGATFTELIHDFIITASAYLYITANENNEIVYTRLDSKNTAVAFDYGVPPYPIALIKIWDEQTDTVGETIKKIEIVTADKKRIFNREAELLEFTDINANTGEQEKTKEKSLLWGDVPVIAFEHPDNISCFEPVMELIEAFESIMTNIKNTTKYNDDAKLKISGYRAENPIMIDTPILDNEGEPTGEVITVKNPAREAEEAALYAAKALFVGEGGDISWLLKNFDYNGILSVLKQVLEIITMISSVPNMTDEAFASANNASALGYKLYSTDQYSAIVDRIFKKGYLRLWEIITNRINLLEGTEYDFRDIDITFSRNIPTDTDKSIQRSATAYNAGIVSLETAINIADIDVDAESEVERIKSEKYDNFEDMQSRIQTFAQNQPKEKTDAIGFNYE